MLFVTEAIEGQELKYGDMKDKSKAICGILKKVTPILGNDEPK